MARQRLADIYGAGFQDDGQSVTISDLGNLFVDDEGVRDSG